MEPSHIVAETAIRQMLNALEVVAAPSMLGWVDTDFVRAFARQARRITETLDAEICRRKVVNPEP